MGVAMSFQRLRPSLQLVSSRADPDSLWMDSCRGSQVERARAAETLAINAFLSRLPRPHAPQRSM